MFRSVGRAVGRHPVRVILAWAALIAGIALITAVAVGNKSETSQAQTDFLPGKYQSVQAARLAAAHFPQPGGARATLVVTRIDHGELTNSDMQRTAGLINRLGRETHLPKLSGVLVSSLARAPNRTAAIATAQFTDSSGQADVIKSMKRLRERTNEAFRNSGLSAAYTGEVAEVADAGAVQQLIVFGTVAAIFVLLLFMFRSIVVAVGSVALMYIVGSVVNMLLAIAAHAWHFKIDDTTQNLLPIVLFGVGTDYVVFFMFRYREQLRTGADHRSAISSAIGLVGEAISSSAAAVIVSFAALGLSQLKSLRLLGPALSLAVLVMLASSLTLIPAVLALTGRRLSRREAWRRAPKERAAFRVADIVSRRPAAALAASLIAFVALGTAAFAMTADYRAPDPPSGSESARAWSEVQNAFPKGVLYPTDVYLHSKDGGRLSGDQRAATTRALTAVSGIGSVSKPILNKSGDTALYVLQLTDDPSSPAAVKLARDRLAPLADRLSTSTQVVKIGGQTMAQADFETALSRDMQVIFPVAALMIGLILVLMLRSLAAPGLLMLSVALGFAATLGASVIAFQGVAGKVGLEGTLPMIVYLFVASIGTDYNILMIARIKEAVASGQPMRQAVTTAIRNAGPTVAAASVVLAASFAVLMLSPYVAQIGFAVAAGVLISMLLSSWLYVPSLALLLDRRIWWPSKAARRAQGSPGECATAMYERTGRQR